MQIDACILFYHVVSFVSVSRGCTVLVTKYCWCNKIRDGEVGWDTTFEMPTGFWLDNLKVRDHWEDQGISVKIILKWMF
jgi:hypothetical protein